MPRALASKSLSSATSCITNALGGMQQRSVTVLERINSSSSAEKASVFLNFILSGNCIYKERGFAFGLQNGVRKTWHACCVARHIVRSLADFRLELSWKFKARLESRLEGAEDCRFLSRLFLMICSTHYFTMSIRYPISSFFHSTNNIPKLRTSAKVMSRANISSSAFFLSLRLKSINPSPLFLYLLHSFLQILPVVPTWVRLDPLRDHGIH